MKILGITGSIASGKSYALKIFKSFPKVLTYSSDQEVHKLFAFDGNLKDEISHVFPEAIINNQVDRTVLGKIVFADYNKKLILESLIYPKLALQRAKLIKKAKILRSDLVVLEIPLLFENHLESECDYVLNIFCNPIIQKQRAMSRDGMTEDKFEDILSSQMPTHQKIKLSDFSINSGHGKAKMFHEVELVHKILTS